MKSMWRISNEQSQVCSINDESGNSTGLVFEWFIWSVVVIALFGDIGWSVNITWTTKLRCKRASPINERSPENKVYRFFIQNTLNSF